MARRPKLVGIDLFAGAGGLSLGAELAGVQVSHAVESNAAAASTYRTNHPHTQVIVQDVRKLSGLDVSRNAASVLFGGPPCQGFSTSNQKTRSVSNPVNWLFREFFRVARTLRPDWIVLENVRGLRETADGQFESLILSSFADLGYSATVWTLAAAEFGVPQYRSRLFFIARRHGTLPGRPKAIQQPAVTVREAIGDLPSLTVGDTRDLLRYRRRRPSAFAISLRGGLLQCTGHLVTKNNDLVVRRYRHIPPGGNWTSIPRALMRNYSNLDSNRSRHSGIYRRLEWDAPSVVIGNYRKNMLVHPEEDRGLSVREAARLQSFPDRYLFHGSIGLQQQQVGNAVPPLLARAVFKSIVDFT